MLYSNTNSAQALEDLKRQIQKEEHDHELKSRELRSLEAEEQNAKNKLDQAQKEFEAKKAKAEAKRKEVHDLESLRVHNQQEMQRMEHELREVMKKH